MGSTPAYYQNLGALSLRNFKVPGYALHTACTDNGPYVNHYARLRTGPHQPLTPVELTSITTDMGMMVMAVNIVRVASTLQLRGPRSSASWTAAQIFPTPGLVVAQIIGSSLDILVHEEITDLDSGERLEPLQH